MEVYLLKKILLVDDNFEFLQLLVRLLEHRFDIITASGVIDAQKILQENKVDIICSDFYMNDGTALDLFFSIKRRYLDTPFIILSGSDLTQKFAMSDKNLFCWDKTDGDLLNKFKTL